MNEACELARVRWRCRRGLLELDLLLGRFVERYYHGLSDAERSLFNQLLQTPDPTLLAYLQGQEDPSPELQPIVAKIRQ
jgi:antitoxin CptB